MDRKGRADRWGHTGLFALSCARRSNHRGTGRPQHPGGQCCHQATSKSLDEITNEEWEATFRTNVHAAAPSSIRPRSAPTCRTPHCSSMPPPKEQSTILREGWRSSGQGRYQGQCRRSRTGMDAAHPVDDAARDGRKFWNQCANEAGGTAWGARYSPRHARGSAVPLYFRRDDRRHRRKAFPLGKRPGRGDPAFHPLLVS